MKLVDKVIQKIDKSLQRFDPIWRAENGQGGQRSRYKDNTGIAAYREWRGTKDTLSDYVAWLRTVGMMGAMFAKIPVKFTKGLFEYRWVGSYLGSFAFLDRLFEGFRGEELKVAHLHSNAIVYELTKKIASILGNDRRLGGGPMTDNMVGLDETIPPLFMAGFPTLRPEPMQSLPEFVICEVDQHLMPHYIDIAESYGLPADVCSRCSAETGVTFDDAFPIFGKMVISTNQPCNASEATSMFQRRRFHSKGLIDYPFVFAMQHNTENGNAYSREELKQAIEKIEEVYNVKYDWDALYESIERMNDVSRTELEKWEIMATPYSPATGAQASVYKLIEWALVNGNDGKFNKYDKKVLEIMRNAASNKYLPFKGKTRYRAFLWGPSAPYYADFPTWIQNCWGVTIVLNMDSTMGHNIISTENPEEALTGVAKLSEKGVMRHHAVGGWDNVNAVWEWAKRLNCDMVICNENVACKGMNGVLSLLEEQAEKHGMKFVLLPQDLEDSRTISRRDMRKTINTYMSVVLGEEPLDPTLVDFDDSLAW
ncbi:2-hydroxyacyl-CoA dehydratase family protein [Guggenheimella bovis]